VSTNKTLNKHGVHGRKVKKKKEHENSIMVYGYLAVSETRQVTIVDENNSVSGHLA